MVQHVRQGAIDVISTSDALIADHLDDLETKLTECLEEGQPHIVLDLNASALIDSRGLELLVLSRADCAQCGGDLKLSGLSPLVKEVLRITDVASNFDIYEDPTSAVRSFV